MPFPCDLWKLDVDANSNGSAHGNANGTVNGHSPLTCGNGMSDIDAFHRNAVFPVGAMHPVTCESGSLMPFTLDLWQ